MSWPFGFGMLCWLTMFRYPELLDPEVISALVVAPTFLGSVGLFASLALGTFAILLILLRTLARRHGGLTALRKRSEGSAAAVDLVLVAPIFTAIVFLVLQFASLANGSLIVHYAAYTATRAALVHSWIYPDDLQLPLTNQPVPNPGAYGAPFRSAAAAATNAARVALVAASPAATRIPKEANGIPESFYRAVASTAPTFRGSNHRQNRARALIERARFAFDESNTKVRVTYPKYVLPDSSYERLDQVGDTARCEPRFGCISRSRLLAGIDKPGSPVTVEVSFPLRLSFPIAANLWCAADSSRCERRGKHLFRRVYAQVTLL